MMYFRRVIRIVIGRNSAPLLSEAFLYPSKREFSDRMKRSGHRRLATSFNMYYQCIKDLLAFNNKLEDYVSQQSPTAG